MKICIDFEGVIKCTDKDEAVKGAAEAIKVLKEKGNTVMVMAKDESEAEKWLKDNSIETDGMSDGKDCDLIISGKTLPFHGEWQEWTMSEIAEFEPYWKRKERQESQENLKGGYTRGEAWAAEREGDKEKAKKLRKEADNMFGIDNDEPVEADKSED